MLGRLQRGEQSSRSDNGVDNHVNLSQSGQPDHVVAAGEHLNRFVLDHFPQGGGPVGINDAQVLRTERAILLNKQFYVGMGRQRADIKFARMGLDYIKRGPADRAG